MKAVICSVSGGVHIHTPGVGKWEICQCGNTGARWEDPEAGKLIVACRDRIAGPVAVLGLNNRLLLPAITAGHDRAWHDYRRRHDITTTAPGFVFDKDKGGCWAVVFPVGYTSDTRWADRPEFLECFPAVSAAEQASDSLIRDVLESLCRRDGLSLESAVMPGEPARNYELAGRLGIGHVFGLQEQS